MNPHMFSRNLRQNKLVSWVVGSAPCLVDLEKAVMANIMGDQLVRSTQKVK